MITPSAHSERRTRPDGAAPRGVLPPSCPTHHGFPAGRCPMCQAAAAPKDAGPARAHRLDVQVVEAAKVLRELDARPRPKAKPRPKAAAPSSPPPAEKLPPPPRVPREAKRAALTAKPYTFKTAGDKRDRPAPLPSLDGLDIRPPDAYARPPRCSIVTLGEDLPPPKRRKPAPARLPAPPKPPRVLQTIDLDGEAVELVTASRSRGLPPPTVRNRLDRGWTVRQALGIDPPPPQRDGKPTNSPRLLTWNGKTQSVNAWAREIGIDHTTMLWRIDRGLTGAELFAPRNASRLMQRRGVGLYALVGEALAAIHGGAKGRAA